MTYMTISDGFKMAKGAMSKQAMEILTPEVIAPLIQAHRLLNLRRVQNLACRKIRQRHFDQGKHPDYLDTDSQMVRGTWSIDPVPKDLQTRRVEITGPINDSKMVINMLNRNPEGVRADTAMLDFEDSMKPSWTNVISGFHNLIGAAKGDLKFNKLDKTGKIIKTYSINPLDMAGVMVRVRGLHLEEANILIDDTPISAGLFDLVVCSFHTAKIFLKKEKTPKFYIPKCEHHLEAKWWDDLLSFIENFQKIQIGSIKVTFLIETLLAAFQVEEILFETKKHIVGLNVGRWDKIFSDIKTLKCHYQKITADRATINMKKYWMDNYAKRLIKICHSRGAYAIGGMSAFTPGKDEQTRTNQESKVMEDKKYEFEIGHDGCWVSHPYFIGPALKCFPKNNQIERKLDSFNKYPNLIMEGKGPKTIQGLRTNIRVAIAYLRGWNNDLGCVSWDNLMEDLATLEISRAQVWQWLYHNITLDCGTKVDRKLIKETFNIELNKILDELDVTMEGHKMQKIKEIKSEFIVAKRDAEEIFLKVELTDFLTLTSNVAKSSEVKIKQNYKKELRQNTLSL